MIELETVVPWAFGGLSLVAIAANFRSASSGSSGGSAKEFKSVTEEKRTELRRLQLKFSAAYFLSIFGE